ncbi:hypothetical protein GBAR_LOCUS240 [Geodia barretti]|uniref:Uncharacterized protein n=1 Tax=Geodia barretti TaxID=519541 RepID=A0AA35QS75_GEOBA|nr:hypothetical protein GBAR_LOCUS240 [Geodia barretti]
MRVHRGRR